MPLFHCTHHRLTWLVLAASLGLAPTTTVHAREDAVLERLLLAGNDYRVRCRAAEALARSSSPVAAPALEAALIDRHPAVRLAAATALGQLKSADALPALRASSKDPVPLVAKHARESIAIIERAQPRTAGDAKNAGKSAYGLFIGELRDHTPSANPGQLAVLSDSLVFELGELAGAEVVAPAAAPDDIPMFRIDGSVLELSRREVDQKLSAHASVALLLTDESDQTLRIVFKGSATAIEDTDPHVANQPERVTRMALRRAVRAALRNASQAIQRGNDKPVKRDRTRAPLEF